MFFFFSFWSFQLTSGEITVIWPYVCTCYSCFYQSAMVQCFGYADWNIGTVLLENHFMSTCQYCPWRNKSKMIRLSNHMLREAVQRGYAGWTRISEVLTRISCSVSYVSKLILLKKTMGSFHSFIPNCHCHGYNILSLRDAEGWGAKEKGESVQLWFSYRFNCHEREKSKS